QSVFGFAVIKVYRSEFLFLLGVLLAIDFGVSRKSRRSRGELDRSVWSRVFGEFPFARCVEIRLLRRRSRRAVVGRRRGCNMLCNVRCLALGGVYFLGVQLLQRSLEIQVDLNIFRLHSVLE